MLIMDKCVTDEYFFFFFFFFLNLSYRGAAIPLPVVRDHLNGNLPTTVPAPEV